MSSSPWRTRRTGCDTLGDVLPLKPFVQSFQDAFNPSVQAPAFQWDSWLASPRGVSLGLLVALTLVPVGTCRGAHHAAGAGPGGSHRSELSREGRCIRN